MHVSDFNRSFVTWKHQNNLYGRFADESSFCMAQNIANKWYLLSGVLACKVLESNDMIIPHLIFFKPPSLKIGLKFSG